MLAKKRPQSDSHRAHCSGPRPLLLLGLLHSCDSLLAACLRFDGLAAADEGISRDRSPRSESTQRQPGRRSFGVHGTEVARSQQNQAPGDGCFAACRTARANIGRLLFRRGEFFDCSYGRAQTHDLQTEFAAWRRQEFQRPRFALTIRRTRKVNATARGTDAFNVRMLGFSCRRSNGPGSLNGGPATRGSRTVSIGRHSVSRQSLQAKAYPGETRPSADAGSDVKPPYQASLKHLASGTGATSACEASGASLWLRRGRMTSIVKGARWNIRFHRPGLDIWPGSSSFRRGGSRRTRFGANGSHLETCVNTATFPGIACGREQFAAAKLKSLAAR